MDPRLVQIAEAIKLLRPAPGGWEECRQWVEDTLLLQEDFQWWIRVDEAATSRKHRDNILKAANALYAWRTAVEKFPAELKAPFEKELPKLHDDEQMLLGLLSAKPKGRERSAFDKDVTTQLAKMLMRDYGPLPTGTLQQLASVFYYGTKNRHKEFNAACRRIQKLGDRSEKNLEFMIRWISENGYSFWRERLKRAE
jgi:hypothetical protein